MPVSYPSNFIGPLPLGVQRNSTLSYPSNFVGPLPSGAYREPASSGGSTPSIPAPVANPTGDYERAARERAEAELAGLNTEFDRNRESLLSQLGSLENQKNQSLGSLDTQLQGVKTTIGNQRTQAQQQTDAQIAQAGNTAKNTQKQNRNVLRGLGILNSSAAGELLSKPINEFDRIRGDLGRDLQSRFTQLDDFLNQRVAEHQNAYQSVINQFNDLTGRIQSDLRFNDRQRADAIRSANAALSQRIAEIQDSARQYQQAVNLQKQQYASAANSLSAYNPAYDPNQILSQAISTQTPQTTQNAQIYEDPRKKQQEGGLLSNLWNTVGSFF